MRGSTVLLERNSKLSRRGYTPTAISRESVYNVSVPRQMPLSNVRKKSIFQIPYNDPTCYFEAVR